MEQRPGHAARRFICCAVSFTATIVPSLALRSEQPSSGSSVPGALQDVELATPFTVAEVKGAIYSSRRQPLADAEFVVDQGHNISVGAFTGVTGSFTFVTPRDPMGWLLHPLLRTLLSTTIGPGPHRFTARKEGFHPVVGTVIVSRDAPKDTAIEVLLQPGPDADDRTFDQRASDWNRLRLPPCAPGANHDPARKKYPGSVLDLPVALGSCVVRTPEIAAVKTSRYLVMLETDASMGHARTNCMLGLIAGPMDRQYNRCLDGDPLLKADWTVWSGDRAVARGSSPLEGHAIWAANSLAKVLGHFTGDAGRKYTVEVKFLKDAGAINAANPHLIVQLN